MTEQEIEQNVIFTFVRGSHAYGLNNADSDEDIGSVALPNLSVITGFDSFEQKDDYVDEKGEKTDKVVYNIMKALDLIENNNPNMLDFLYAPDHCIRLLRPEWETIMSVRDQFLCKKAKWAYQGYALSQLSRIETHRGYLLNPMKKPTREQFKLPEVSIFPANQLAVIARLASDYIDDPKMQDKFYSDMSALFDHEGAILFKKYINRDMAPFAIADFKQRQDAFLRTITSVSQKFLKDEFQDIARRELKFLAAEKQWTDYKRWDKERNPKRKLLEQKCGYDAKHAGHLVRLLKVGLEIMEGKGVQVDRTNIDRDELYEIRMGNVKFDIVMQKAKDLNDAIENTYKTNNILPITQDPKLTLDLKKNIVNHILSKGNLVI